MIKAEEKAMGKYPPHSILIVPARSGGYYADKHLRDGYIEGYKQAEKDLELTYDDICEIMEIREDVLEMDSYENLYQEVLKRFKEMKETKD